jgi:methyl coenzyme M reductase subunit C
MNKHEDLIATFLAIPDDQKAQAFVDFVATVVISNQSPTKCVDDLARICKAHIKRRSKKS